MGFMDECKEIYKKNQPQASNLSIDERCQQEVNRQIVNIQEEIKELLKYDNNCRNGKVHFFYPVGGYTKTLIKESGLFRNKYEKKYQFSYSITSNMLSINKSVVEQLSKVRVSISRPFLGRVEKRREYYGFDNERKRIIESVNRIPGDNYFIERWIHDSNMRNFLEGEAIDIGIYIEVSFNV